MSAVLRDVYVSSPTPSLAIAGKAQLSVCEGPPVDTTIFVNKLVILEIFEVCCHSLLAEQTTKHPC